MEPIIGKYYVVDVNMVIPGVKMPTIGRKIREGVWSILLLDETDLCPEESMDIIEENIVSYREFVL